MKDEADFIAAEAGELAIAQFRHHLAVEQIFARARNVEQAEHVHECAFAGAGRPDNRHEFARLDGEINVMERDGGLVAVGEGLANFAQLDDVHELSLTPERKNRTSLKMKCG